jgi:4-hydroxy-tetrahydrodipicolinate synthase
MVTPFREDGRLDEGGLAALVEWYLTRGVDGLFAVCQSSEMFELDLDERVRLARATVEAAAGRVPVIASGHISDDPREQAREMNAMARTGVSALILVNNRLAAAGEDDEVWKGRCERLFAALPREVPLGFYECPHPYKRLFTPQLLRWCADTGRVTMLKDTCCDPEQICLRQKAVDGTLLGIYNANAATLLETLRCGIAGYSGVMANFHPQLYVWLCRNWASRPGEAERLQAYLGAASAIEGPRYPRNAKAFLQLEGLAITTVTRRDCLELGPADRRLIEQFRALSAELSSAYR